MTVWPPAFSAVFRQFGLMLAASSIGRTLSFLNDDTGPASRMLDIFLICRNQAHARHIVTFSDLRNFLCRWAENFPSVQSEISNNPHTPWDHRVNFRLWLEQKIPSLPEVTIVRVSIQGNPYCNRTFEYSSGAVLQYMSQIEGVMMMMVTNGRWCPAQATCVITKISFPVKRRARPWTDG